MGEKRTVKMIVHGSEYKFLAEEPDQYIQKIASEVDARIGGIMNANPSASVTMAAILTAVNMCDELTKSRESVENLRRQVATYVEDAAAARSEAEAAKRELNALKNDMSKLQRKLDEKHT